MKITIKGLLKNFNNTVILALDFAAGSVGFLICLLVQKPIDKQRNRRVICTSIRNKLLK